MNDAISFWDAHTYDWVVLIGLALFPRITMLFIGGPLAALQWFGVLHWIGWVVAPHLLVAIVATTMYWDTDPILCVVAWFFAFAGTGGEGKLAHHRTRRRRRRADDRAD